MPARLPRPTLGYPSQTNAIHALYDAGSEPEAIAKAVGAPINSVHRALAVLRERRGLTPERRSRKPARLTLAVDAWPKTSHDWRMLNFRRSVAGARKALEAAHL